MSLDRKLRGQTTEDVAVSSLLRGLRAARTEPPASPAATAPGIPAPGERIAGKYVVEHVLGMGGMGVVLAAKHAQLGHRVAIKFMQGKAARDKNAVGRFLREARAAAALSSEHVAKVHDVGTLESGEPYSVMEYLSGVDLKQVLRNTGPLGVADAVGAVLQACEAIGEAHAMGIVHRDLKPSNLFVTQRIDGTPLVKVLDFGISKVTELNALGTDQSLTPSGSVVGSPQYMSPEQVRNAREVDARSDIWALGVILYELLTGATPFAGETLGATLAKILAETAAPIAAKRPDVPEALAATVARCLERDVNARVQNVGELAAALLPFASGDATIAGERILRAQRASSAPAGSGAPGASGGSRASASGGTGEANARPGKGHTLRMQGAAGGPPVAAQESADAAAIAPTLASGSPMAGPEMQPEVRPVETGAPWQASGADRTRRAGVVRAVVGAVVLGAVLLVGVAATVAMKARSQRAAPAAPSSRVLPAAAGESGGGGPSASPAMEPSVAPSSEAPSPEAARANGAGASAAAGVVTVPAQTNGRAMPTPASDTPAAASGAARKAPSRTPSTTPEPGDPFGPMRSK